LSSTVHTTFYKKVDNALNIDSFVFPNRVKLASLLSTPILIWTMTKVGTTSIARSLQKKLGTYRVFGEHNLNDSAWPRSVILYQELIEKKRPIKILTAVRDPISQSVSNFFHRYEFYTGDSATSPSLSIEEAVSAFVRADIDISWTTWFDNNLKRYLNLDIYQYPSPAGKDHLRINHQNVDLLLLKAEADNTAKEAAIIDFLNLDNFTIQDQNVGNTKAYGAFYQAFKHQAKLPEHYLNCVRNSQYINHFYTPSEIDTIFKKWTKHT